jgi:hypothetical protein
MDYHRDLSTSPWKLARGVAREGGTLEGGIAGKVAGPFSDCGPILFLTLAIIRQAQAAAVGAESADHAE